MDAKALKTVFTAIRKAVDDVNTAKNEEFFDVKLSAKELVVKFIEYCKTTEDEVPESVQEAWNMIPDEWEDANAIPDFTRPKTRAAGRKRAPMTEEEKAAKEAEKAAKKAEKEAARAEAKAKRAEERAAKKAQDQEERALRHKEKVKESYKSESLSRYGHRKGSASALIDEALYAGINHEELIRKILENNPDSTEERAHTKIRDHINYLPKKRGISVIITLEDGKPAFYKVDEDTWCKDPTKVVPTENIVDDLRTPKVKDDTPKAPRPRKAKKVKKTDTENAEQPETAEEASE